MCQTMHALIHVGMDSYSTLIFEFNFELLPLCVSSEDCIYYFRRADYVGIIVCQNN